MAKCPKAFRRRLMINHIIFIIPHSVKNRESKMKKFRIFSIILCLAMGFGILAPSASALSAPELDGKAALVVDLDSGRFLYALNAEQQRAPASLTKVMTVLLALEAVDRGDVSLNDTVTAQQDCREGLGEDSSTAGIIPGVQLSLRELLYCAMVGSANEACNVIGSYLSGSVSAFVDRMNQRASQLGCVNTHFVNTNGLPAEDHYSTAYDLYLITTEAMKHPLFMEMANTIEYQPESRYVNDGKVIHNSNALISQYSDYNVYDSYLYEGASGIKTGYTRAAGYCLISTAERGGVRALVIIMGCNGYYNAGIEEFRNFSDSITLYNWVFDNFSYRELIGVSEPMEQVQVKLAEGDGEITLYPQQALTALLPGDFDTENREVKVTVYEDKLTAPLEAGTVLGEARILINGDDYGTVRLVNRAQVELAKGEFMRLRLRQFFSNGWVITLLVIIVLLAAAYLALVTRYRRLRRKHLQERRRAEERRRQRLQERQRAAAEVQQAEDSWKEL